jgi:uncharacterized DUF497 family protein
MYEWDENKRLLALAKHGIDFADVDRFDWATAITRPDRRKEYGEIRFVSYGQLDGRLHCCAWTLRSGRIRIVMLRKANARERRRYE